MAKGKRNFLQPTDFKQSLQGKSIEEGQSKEGKIRKETSVIFRFPADLKAARKQSRIVPKPPPYSAY